MKGGFPNIRHMRVFIEAARSGSVSIAAQRCHLSQPAATQAIAQLEKDLATSLLVRHRQQLSLTQSGTAFERRANAALDHLRNGARAALRAGGEKRRNAPSFDHSVTAAQLRNLIAIANTGSFSVAASTLSLSQPTVHRTARTLEALAGVPFFSARASGVRLTPAAEVFVLGAKLAQAEIRQGREEISRELNENKGIFVLGSLPLARTMIVPKAIHETISATDNFQIRVVDGRYAELLRSLREGDLDCLIGALRYPIPAEDVTQELLFRDRLAIVAHPSHPLAKQSNLTLEDTLKYPWIAPPKETPAGHYLFETLRIQERPKTVVRAVSSSMAILRGVLAQGDYLSIVSRHQISVDESLGAIAVLDVALKGDTRDIGLTFRKGWRATELQEQFIQYLRKYGTNAPISDRS